MKHCPSCGVVLDGKPTASPKDRSHEEHNLLFGMINEAFISWPESHAFQPDDAEHLRAWMQIEINDCEEFEVPDILAADPKTVAQIGLFFCSGKRHFRMVNRGTQLIIKRPRTLNRSRSVEEFRVVSTLIMMLIEQSTGITAESYKAHKEAQKRRAMA